MDLGQTGATSLIASTQMAPHIRTNQPHRALHCAVRFRNVGGRFHLAEIQRFQGPTSSRNQKTRVEELCTLFLYNIYIYTTFIYIYEPNASIYSYMESLGLVLSHSVTLPPRHPWVSMRVNQCGDLTHRSWRTGPHRCSELRSFGERPSAA